MATTPKTTGRNSGKSATPTTTSGHDTAVQLAQVHRIVWLGQNVITTEPLAALYKTQPNNISVNHSRNPARFKEGKHYFKVAGDDLKNLRLTFGKSQISQRARSLILWTERGAARHAKMLETDRAWDVFEALEDSYFRTRERCIEPTNEKSTVLDRLPLYEAAAGMMAKHRLSMPRAYQALNLYAGVRHFAAMTMRDVAVADRFASRYLANAATREDFARIERHRAELLGESPQLAFFDGTGCLLFEQGSIS